MGKRFSLNEDNLLIYSSHPEVMPNNMVKGAKSDNVRHLELYKFKILFHEIYYKNCNHNWPFEEYNVFHN